jgi:hypothetical protein
MTKLLSISNPICIGDHCDTIVLSYTDVNNVFGFNYTTGFEQQVRIPATLQNFKHERAISVYRKTSGTFVQHSVQVDKKAILKTDWLDEIFTDALTTAAGHSIFKLDGVSYSGHGEITENDNEYDNLTQIELVVFEQGYNQTNLSC